MHLQLIPLGIVLVFYVVFLVMGKPLSIAGKDWFSTSRFDNTWWMLLSLLATNLTVSGGIIASVSGSHYYGPWFLLAPLSAAAGLFIFACSHSGVAKRLTKERCFLNDLAQGKASPLLLSFAAASLIIGAFIAGWEIHIASRAIAAFYGDIQAVASNLFLISLGMAVLAGLYISRGGWDRSVFTDIIQAITVLLFLLLLAYKLIAPSTVEFSFPRAAPISSFSLWMFGLALFINNIGYSLVSPNNWQIAQSAGRISVPLFFLGALILVLFSVSIYFLSAFVPAGNPFSVFASKDLLTAFMIPVIPLFVWSTIDTSSVALSHLAEGLLPSSLKPEANNDPTAIDNLRKHFPLIFLVFAVLVSHLLNTWRPNIFQSLLAATTSLIIFVPVLYCGGLDGGLTDTSSRRCAKLMFALFLLILVGSCAMVFTGLGEYVFALSLFGLAIGTALIRGFKRKEATGAEPV